MELLRTHPEEAFLSGGTPLRSMAGFLNGVFVIGLCLIIYLITHELGYNNCTLGEKVGGQGLGEPCLPNLQNGS